MIRKDQKVEQRAWLVDLIICLLLLSGAGLLLYLHLGWDYAYHGHQFLPVFKTLYGRSTLYNEYHGTPFAFFVEGQPYTHHPPMLIVFLQLSHWVTGETFGPRAVPVFFSLATTVVLYIAPRFLWGRRVAVLTVLGFLLTPMFLLFGNFVNFEPPSLFFVVLAWSFYAVSTRLGHNAWLIASVVTVFVGCFVDWPVYFLGLALCVHGWLDRKRRGMRGALSFLVVCLVAFGIFLVHVRMQTGSVGGGELWKSLWNRIGFSTTVVPMVPTIGESRLVEYGMMEWMFRIGGNLTELVTVALLIGFAGWMLSWFRDIEGRSGEALLWLLLAPAIFNTCVFNGLAWEHSYAQYYFVPGCAMATALALDRFVQWLDAFRLGWIALLGFLIALGAQAFHVVGDWDGFVGAILTLGI